MQYIPEPPSLPVSGSGSEIVEQLTALGEPTLQSLGLASWFPSGLVQSGLEALHVGLNVPWWTSIVLGKCQPIAVILFALWLVIIWSSHKWTRTGSGTSVIWSWSNRTESVTRYTPALDCYLLTFGH